MSQNNEKDETLASERLSNRAQPLVLYIGRKGPKVSDRIINYPWGCVVTSIPDAEFAVEFREENKREVEELKTITQVENLVTLNRRSLKFIHLFNNDNPKELKRRKNKEAAAMLTLVTTRMRSAFGSLIIIGYDPTDKDELPSDKLTEIFDTMREKSAFLFDCDIAGDENLTAAVSEGRLVSLNSALCKYLPEITEPEDWGGLDSEPLFDEDDTILFINKKPISIDSGELFHTKYFSKLLSTTELGNLSVPHELQKKYFYKFLSESVSMPMWFGFENRFNLQRTFEKELKNNVLKALRNIKDRESQGLIILSGQTGSSKSIALAHLAFRIFKEGVYPVIFIDNKNVSLRQGDERFNALDKLIHTLEKKGAQTILLIWDNSTAYSDPLPNSLALLRGLRNRGRQCVLVCSAYMVDSDLLQRHVKAGIRVNEIKTNIELDSSEKKIFYDKILKFGSIHKEVLDSYIKNEQNLLALSYHLFTDTLATSIASGVCTEVSRTSKNIDLKIQEILFPKSDKFNTMASQLINAGYSVEDDDEESDTPDNSKNIEKLLKIIALSSQFDIEFPLQFALTVAGLERFENNFAKTIRNLQQIPFLRLPEPSNINSSNYGQYILFRTQLEARLYIEDVMTAEEEVNLVVDLINALNNQHQHMEASAVESLIRIMGPNSYLKSNPVEENKVKKYEPYYEKITNALYIMRCKRKISIPRLMCQEVCWLREVFGKNDKLTNKIRIKKLNEAIDITNHALEKMPLSELSREEQCTKNTLVVENATSTWQVNKLLRDESHQPQELFFNYSRQKKALKGVISNSPNNSYAFNALLKLYIAVHESSEEKKYIIEELGDLLSLIDSYEHIMGEALYNREFIYQRERILQFVNNSAVESYLEDLIKDKHPLGLYLWGRRSLAKSSIDLDTRVSQENDTILEEIIERFESLIEVVKTHNGCLYMLLQLNWQLFNHGPIFEHEKQFTQMSAAQWNKIASLCPNALSNTEGNIARLLYISALAKAQIGDYNASLKEQQRLYNIKWMPPRSTYVWHILSNEDGSPKKFTGTIEKRDDSLMVTGAREVGTNQKINRPIFARNRYNLELNKDAGTFDDIEIGLNFKGFQAFRKLSEKRS